MVCIENTQTILNFRQNFGDFVENSGCRIFSLLKNKEGYSKIFDKDGWNFQGQVSESN